MITTPQVFKLYEPILIDKDYGSGVLKVSTHNLQAWANQINDCVGALDTNQQRHAHCIASLEETINKMQDILNFVREAHPEVLKEYALNREAAERMTK